MTWLTKRLLPISSEDLTLIGRTFSYLKGYKRRYILLIMITLCGLGIGLLQPLIFGRLLDAIVRGQGRQLLRYIGLIFVVYVSHSLLSLVETYLTIDINTNIFRDIKNDLFRRLIDLPLSIYEQKPPGELVNRIEGDSGTLSNLLVKRSMSIIIDLGKVLGIGFLLLSISWQLTLILLIFFPISLYLFGLFGKILKKYNKKI